jgi:hemolysin-activating ACP:hemolysin acyltransferase
MQTPPTGSTSTPAPLKSRPELRVFRPDNSFVALGLTVNHLMTMPAFANLRFGEWSKILVGQINRKHYWLVIDDKNEIQGFLGWALTTRERAEEWLEGRSGRSDQDSAEGDSIIFNAWAGKGLKVNRFLLLEARKVGIGKEMIYFKRYYKDGTTRPSRLTVNEFVSQHIEEATPPRR